MANTTKQHLLAKMALVVTVMAVCCRSGELDPAGGWELARARAQHPGAKCTFASPQPPGGEGYRLRANP
jgi:hypothetical protein